MAMRVVDVTARAAPPTVAIEAAPAYELLLSLSACHDTDMHNAADGENPLLARARALASPDLLAEIAAFNGECEKTWIHLLGLAYASPAPKDVRAFLAYVESLDPRDLVRTILTESADASSAETSAELIRRAMAGDEAARRQVRDRLAPDDDAWRAQVDAFITRDPAEMKRQLLHTVERWHTEVFSVLEVEIVPVLLRDAEAKRVLQGLLPYERFIEVATNGVRYVPEPGIRRVMLIPSFVSRPWVMITRYRDVKLICHPVATESIAEGDEAPPERLVNLYKALSDERRLRVLKKLTMGSYTLQELADALGVAKSTMHHHVVTLRIAGLISVSSDPDKRYTLRLDTIPDASALLQVYLARASP
jgi:DNA-binding transcriptional ArsR family regulator